MNGESPEQYRLINFRRQLKDMLMSRRLAMDPERTGIVELSDFGRRCDDLAAFAQESAVAFPRGGVRIVAEEVELAARLAARMETLPRSSEREESQTRLLEEVARLVEAALASEGVVEEPPVLLGLATLARTEREFFAPFLRFSGDIHEAPPGMIERGPLRRALRRALLDHDEEGEPFRLEVTKDGTLVFGEFSCAAEPLGDRLPRSPLEPPEVKRALDMREGTSDESLRDFLLVKAVDEALAALLSPALAGSALMERARALPRRPGKRMAVRPEAVQRAVAGWNAPEALKGVERLAARRIGPDWARLPKGAYFLRLFLSDDDELAADLLALGGVLRRMEKGEEAGEDVGRVATVALGKLLGLLG